MSCGQNILRLPFFVSLSSSVAPCCFLLFRYCFFIKYGISSPLIELIDLINTNNLLDDLLRLISMFMYAAFLTSIVTHIFMKKENIRARSCGQIKTQYNKWMTVANKFRLSVLPMTQTYFKSFSFVAF